MNPVVATISYWLDNCKLSKCVIHSKQRQYKIALALKYINIALFRVRFHLLLSVLTFGQIMDILLQILVDPQYIFYILNIGIGPISPSYMCPCVCPCTFLEKRMQCSHRLLRIKIPDSSLMLSKIVVIFCSCWVQLSDRLHCSCM